jgi:hypothetical protein
MWKLQEHFKKEFMRQLDKNEKQNEDIQLFLNMLDYCRLEVSVESNFLLFFLNFFHVLQKDYDSRLAMFDLLKAKGLLTDDSKKPEFLQTPVYVLEEFRDHPLVMSAKEKFFTDQVSFP